MGVGRKALRQAWVFDGTPRVFDRVGPILLAIFPLTTMLVVTSVATLRLHGTRSRAMPA